MTQFRFLLLASMFFFFSFAAADDVDHSSHFALQGVFVSAGYLGFGAVHYSPKTEIGFSLSGSVNNESHQTKHFSPGVFAGLRVPLLDSTDFAYGVDADWTYGRTHGYNINSEYQVGPYIALEQMLTKHLMLTGWIQPYQYQYEKLEQLHATGISTNSFFSTGGIALSYLF